ncbi:MAG: hypothetical protein Q8L92_17535, partial [Rubrivivax sp.]|nr:hypothetical protein [Rubrivivax sp.]
MPDAARHQARDGCPRCRGSLLRVHRRLQDLPAGTDEGWRRYRCSVATCAWEGLLQRRDHSASRWSVLVESWPRLALLGLAGLTALGAVAAVYQLVSAEASVLVGPHVLQRGQHHDGDWLPADHPLLARVQQRPASAPDASAVMAQPPPRATDPKPPQPVVVAAALAVTVAAAMSPDADALVLSLPATTLSAGVKPKPPAPAPTSLAALHLRRHCAWAQPGRSPYRGTVEQALGLAQLPPEVVRQVA